MPSIISVVPWKKSWQMWIKNKHKQNIKPNDIKLCIWLRPFKVLIVVTFWDRPWIKVANYTNVWHNHWLKVFYLLWSNISSIPRWRPLPKHTLMSSPGGHICMGSTCVGVCDCIPYIASFACSLALSAMKTICTVMSLGWLCERVIRVMAYSLSCLKIWNLGISRLTNLETFLSHKFEPNCHAIFTWR